MLFAIAVILILIADQGLKYWVTLAIPLDEGVRALIPGFLELRNIHNTGAAFSLLAGAPRWIFILLAAAFIVIIIVAVRRKWVHGAFGRWMAILLLAGALGNCLDRMLSGYVVDMLAFQFWPSFPVFNIADICIVIGGIGFFLHALLYKEPETVAKEAERKAKKQPDQTDRRPTKVAQTRPQREKPASQPVSPSQPTQRMDLKSKTAMAQAPKAETTPAPAADETPRGEDPFTAWDQDVRSSEQRAKERAAAAASPEPIPEPKPSEVKPTVQRPARANAPVDDFSLEDILAEFKD